MEKNSHMEGSIFVCSMITMMYVIGKLARDLHYVSESDLLPGCDQGGPGYACRRL
jgi:hypothetical protein